MARNLNAIKKRISSITSTQKITNAMRLVSMSKLQQYKRQQDQLAPYFREVAKKSRRFGIPQAPDEYRMLYIVFAPDLGLVSAFTNGLLRFIKELPKGDFLWIGTQGYEMAKKRGLHVMNKKMSSEQLDLDYFIDDTNEYLEDYEVSLIVPSYGASFSLEFAIEELNVYLENEEDVVYYPNFEAAQVRFREIVMKAMIYYTYYSSKFSEYTTRRIAMENATQNADDMIEDLQLKYNRARQEAITQEILELSAGMEA